MTSVGGSVHGREPSEPPVPRPHRARARAGRGALEALAVALVAVVGCGGGPDASVGVTVVDGAVEVRAEPCEDVGIHRVVIAPVGAPDEPVWTAEAENVGTTVVPVADAVDGYRVTDRRRGGELPDAHLRVRVEGPDGRAWGGPRFRPDELEEGTIRVAGRDIPLADWEAEPAQCPSFTLVDALLGGLVTAAVAAALWLVVRLVGWAVRRSDPDQVDPPSQRPGDAVRR